MKCYLTWQRDFTDLITDWEPWDGKIILGYPGGPSESQAFFKVKGGGRRGVSEGNVKSSQKCGFSGLQDGGRVHELRIVYGLWKLEKAKT